MESLCITPTLLLVFLVVSTISIFSLAEAQDVDRGRFHVIQPSQYAHLLKGDYPWAIKNVPFIDFPENDDILNTYYYRWRMYRKHIEYIDEEDIYVVTEFLPQVSWSGLYNTIPAAAGHHIMEGRWIHNERILNDYIQFWFTKAIPVAYTNWIGHAAWQRYLLNRNATFVKSIQDGLDHTFQEYYISKYLKEITSNNNTVNQCWWQDDGRDAMEVSISGSGCRPTIAAAMYGEAETIVKLARMEPLNRTLELDYMKWQELSRSIILDHHWNQKLQSFAVIPTVPEMKGSEKHEVPDGVASDCDLSNVRQLNKTVDVRELLAFMPWYFDTLIPEEQVSKFLPMWKELFDPDGFDALYGLRSAELRHPCYNYSYDHGDCWNGPSWPYETSRVLTGFANLLNRDIIRDKTTHKFPSVSPEKYWHLLKQYARQHTRTYAVNDTANPIGSGHVFENLHPDLGYWNNRQRMYESNDDNKNMGDDYNHSTFVDLILSGLFGIRPQEDGSMEVSPLLPSAVSAFAVDNVLWQGKFILSVIWDKTGTAYDRGQGLSVLLDGKTVAHSRTMKRIVLYPEDLKQGQGEGQSSMS